MNKPLTKYELLLLIEKQRLGTCTKDEENLLTNWFEKVPAIEDLTFISEEEKQKIKSDIHTAIQTNINPEVAGKTRKFILGRMPALKLAAAVITILLSVWVANYLFWKGGSNKMVTIETPAGIEKMPVVLPDNSIVWLSGRSTITYPSEFETNIREMSLSGSAYFDVQPNKKVPFVINTASSISVKVLGTSFVIDARKEVDDFKISVVTGRVQVNDGKENTEVLSPGESASYSHRIGKFSKQNYIPEEISSWKNNAIIYLNNVSISELAVLLNTMYHTNLIFNYEQTAHYKLNMSFSKDLPLDQVLDMLNKITGLNFKQKDKNIEVTL